MAKIKRGLTIVQEFYRTNYQKMGASDLEGIAELFLCCLSKIVTVFRRLVIKVP